MCDNLGVSRLKVQGKLYTNDKEKADILNNQFTSVFSEEDDQVPTILSDPVLTMPSICVPLNGVRKLLPKIDPNKTTGTDGITGRFLKEVADEMPQL